MRARIKLAGAFEAPAARSHQHITNIDFLFLGLPRAAIFVRHIAIKQLMACFTGSGIDYRRLVASGIRHAEIEEPYYRISGLCHFISRHRLARRADRAVDRGYFAARDISALLGNSSEFSKLLSARRIS